MQTKEINASRDLMKIELTDDSQQLEEVVVVGYGQQKKASVVGAITQTTGKVLERAAGISDIGTALTGNLPGVVTTASSWNNSAPLVLVDGIERPMSFIENYRNQTSIEQMERNPNIDWQDALFKDYTMSYNANVNVAGGTKFVKYYAAVDFVSEGDLYRKFPSGRNYDTGYDYKRFNIRSNLDFNITKTTIFKVNIAGSNGVRKSPWSNSVNNDWQVSQQNGKLKSLIKWIERWEADGVTKIDGIGSQMHISCYANATTQESKKNAIVESFKLMAASGKLVRISELDMGYIDASGNSVATIYLTEEQHQQMAELYTFVVSKYLEIIPAAQQWGICQWAATDSPAKEGNWRADEPIGLWDEGYNRKHTYAGFADGLAGK